MNYITRINLKTDSKCDRKELIEFCLNSKEKQYIAIGWSYLYEEDDCKEIMKHCTFDKFFECVGNKSKRMNHAVNVFANTKEDELFWTRDLDGYYWICRTKGKAQSLYDAGIDINLGLKMDIGAVIPVEAYRYGTDVPGAIKASFNRPRGGIAHTIWDELLVAFSEKVYNELCEKEYFQIQNLDELKKEAENNFINSLPDFELEELVMTYIQVKYNYYLLSNSIANKSTTKKIEGEFYSREKGKKDRAVVQVKGPGRNEVLSAEEFKTFLEDGYRLFLYANKCDAKGYRNVEIIKREDLEAFYRVYKENLPNSITEWENILK